MENDKTENSFLFFGYGSSLNPTLVEFRINQPVKILGKAELKGYTLKFNRKNPDGSARGNLTQAENDYTLGLLYQISKTKFDQLTQTEPKYDLTEFDVLTEKGTVKAFAFICTLCELNIYPSQKYVETIIESATLNNFPESYIEKIKLQIAPTK